MNSLRGNANANCVRFAHSEICGSMYACYSPQLIAAGHVFHRSLAPRHPPRALNNLLLLNTRSFFDSIKLCATSFDIASYQKDLLLIWMFFHRILFSNYLASFSKLTTEVVESIIPQIFLLSTIFLNIS